jgi:hypothetical protein
MDSETRAMFDELRNRLEETQAELENLRALTTGRIDDPYREVFVARREAAGWQEQAIVAGEIVDFVGGRSSAGGDDAEIIPLGSASILLRLRDGNFFRYVEVAGGLFYVTLSTDGGTAGDASTPASFTYTVFDAHGTEIGSSIPLIWARPNITMAAATVGIAFMENDTVRLLIADEVPTTTTECAS